MNEINSSEASKRSPRPNRRGNPFLGHLHVGKKYNLLTVNKVFRENGRTNAICTCDCGKEWKCDLYQVTHSITKSCGCLRFIVSSELHKTHGMSKSRTHRAWLSMKERCLNVKSKFYPDWGGRGITICERWIYSFENFLEDMGICPDKLTLDRIDNSKGYCKENCRWADRSTQNKNRRPFGDGSRGRGLRISKNSLKHHPEAAV